MKLCISPLLILCTASLLCQPASTFLVLQPNAMCQANHVTNGLLCQDIPNVCISLYGGFVCQGYCTCHLYGGSLGPTGGGGGPVVTGTAPPPGSCEDNVGHGLECRGMLGVCNDPTSVGPRYFCPRFCQTCATTSQPTTLMMPPTTITTTPTTTTSTLPTTTTAAPCVDIEIFGKTCSQLNTTLDVCTDSYGQRSCPDFCGQCPCVGKPRNASADCVDQAGPEVCALPGFCSDQFAPTVCKKTCFPHLCLHAGCQDTLNTDGEACAEQYGAGKLFATVAELCADTLGAKVCQATCGCPGFCP